MTARQQELVDIARASFLDTLRHPWKQLPLLVLVSWWVMR